MKERKKVTVIKHPHKEGKFILIAEKPDGQKIAFETDQKGK